LFAGREAAAMAITLRKADVNDCEAIRKLQAAAFAALLEKYQDHDLNPGAETAEKIRWRLEYPNASAYFIKLADEVIGYIRIYDLGGGACRLSLMCILPEYQGRGFAQGAIRLAEALYPDAVRWELRTIKQEAKLRHLYEKLGYRLTGNEEHVKDGMDLIGYEKLVNK
jgi:RimJ/RimL family protein N-acetyltransferase